jgi:hypothetical protein
MKRQVLEVLSGKGNTSALTTNDLFILVNETTEITDIFVTGGTYSSGTTEFTFTNNTGGTFNVTGFYIPSATTAYKVFTALLTQSGGDNTQYINWDDNPNTLTIGVTYTITENTATDFIPNGAPNNDVGTIFIATSSVVRWDKSNTGPNQVSYNTGAPIATVLENTLGFNPYFIYGSVGAYSSQNSDWNQYLTNSIPVQTFINCGNYSVNYQFSAKANYSYEEARFFINSFNNGELADDVLSDIDGFFKTSLEIRVYN